MMIADSSELNLNIERLQERIFQSAQNAGRDPEKIDLIAVTKNKSAAVIKTLFENGINKIGESYLKEALFKINLLEGYEIEWHMIGNIQRGKEKQIVLNFSELHSVDRIEIAENLNKKAGQYNLKLPIYLECNVSGQPSKHGWPAWEEDNWECLIPDFEKVLGLSSLQIKGLMTMAPYFDDPELARPFFKKLRNLREYLVINLPRYNYEGLSMGMSGDFEVAIEEGATMLRIGSALVGHR